MQLMRCSGLLTFGSALLAAGLAEGAGLSVDADFPGGNIVVDKIEGADIYVHQDLRDTVGDWFYWCFRVRGAAEREITVHFTKSNVLGVRGPAVSLDAGVSWKWLGKERVNGQSFSYRVASGQDDVRFAMAMPYTEANLKAFLAAHAGNPNLEVDTLCRTRAGRDAEVLRLGRLTGMPDYRVLLTCRHHCCEMMASYALEGIMGSVLADDEQGSWFREHVEFLVVPFVDKDGVQQGDQGKNRKPRDHNRDYAGESIYATTATIRKRVPEWGGGRVAFAMDMHCPYIRGRHNEDIYFVGMEDPDLWTATQRFSRILESVCDGTLPYKETSNLPFGQGWNTTRNYQAGKSCSRWTGSLPDIRFAASIEVPYANAGGAAVTQDSARAFGGALAHAIRLFLTE